VTSGDSGGPCWPCILGGTTMVALAAGVVYAAITYVL
jgi:hypothetical protein